MTGPEIEKRKTELYSKYYGENSRTLDNLKMAWTKEDETEMEELSCRDMINSCLIYGSDPFHTTTKHWCGHGYCERSYMSDYEDVLGKKRVKVLVGEQRETISKSTIQHNVYEDSEGCTYNSVDW